MERVGLETESVEVGQGGECLEMNGSDEAVVQDEDTELRHERKGFVPLVSSRGSQVVEVVVRQVQSLQTLRHLAEEEAGHHSQTVPRNIFNKILSDISNTIIEAGFPTIGVHSTCIY